MDKQAFAHRKTLLIASIMVAMIMFLALIGCQPAPQQTSSPPFAAPYSTVIETQPLSEASITPSAAPAAASMPCSDQQPALITDFEIRPVPELLQPAPRTPFRDPVFGTCLVRVTDYERDFRDSGRTGGLKNEYSRVQSFNADGTLIAVLGTEGGWYLYDAISLQPLKPISIGLEPRWDATDPDVLYYIDAARLMALNVRSDESRVVHDFAADLPDFTLNAVWTRYEGSPSYDGRYWGLMAEDQDWLTVAFLIYDQQTDQVIALRPTPDRPEIDSVTISPLGNYFLVWDDYCERGQLGTDAAPCGLMVYDRTLKNGRGLVRIIGHADTALDASGREVLVYQEIDTDHISMLDLETGAVTDLLTLEFPDTSLGVHLSGRASTLPGWALVSTHTGTNLSATWMADSVFAVELKAGGRVVRLAHTYSLVDESQEHDYWAEPQATMNQDFTRVLFTTNWGRSGTDQVDMVMISLPPDWTQP